MKQIDMNVTVFFHLKWQNEKFHQDKPWKGENPLKIKHVRHIKRVFDLYCPPLLVQ
jgi:hypothetical protein